MCEYLAVEVTILTDCFMFKLEGKALLCLVTVASSHPVKSGRESLVFH